LRREFPEKLVDNSTWLCTFCKKKGHHKGCCPASPSPRPAGHEFEDEKFFSRLFEPRPPPAESKTPLEEAIREVDEAALPLMEANPFRLRPNSSLWALRKQIPFWGAIGCPKEQLSWLAYGYKLPFLAPPPCIGFENHPGAFQYFHFVDEELAKRVAKGQFSIVHSTFAAQLHPLDVVPKASGGYRLILDCRLINSFLPDVHFKLENLAVVPHIVNPGDWMFSTDLEDAYFHIPIHPDSLKHLCFRWRNVTYCTNVLPFGLGLAPWIFTKTLRPLVRYCRTLGISMMAYLDDFLWAAQEGDIQPLVDFVRALLARLGFAVSDKKSEWTPTRVLLFLGLLINTEAFAFEVPPARLERLRKALETLRKQHEAKSLVRARDIAKVCGHLLSVWLAVNPAGIYSRALYAALREAPAWNALVPLSEDARQELDFWQTSLARFNGKAMNRPPSAHYLHTDASDSGWGAHVGSASAFGRFADEVKVTSSTHRELTALLCALRSPEIRKHIRNARVSFVLDSTAAVYNLNNGGGPVPDLSRLVKEIWHECLALEVDASAEWVSRDKNERADALSRHRDTADWSLRDDLFLLMDRKWGPHTVDRFASFYNTKCKRFNSKHYDHKAEAFDAFTQVWAGENNYAHPPFDLIWQTLCHAQRDGAQLTLVFPRWTQAPWFLQLMKLASDVLELPPCSASLIHGPRSTASTPIPNWNLCAARFDFAQNGTKKSQQTQSSLPSRQGSGAREAHTLRTSAPTTPGQLPRASLPLGRAPPPSTSPGTSNTAATREPQRPPSRG
jgi:hypothetical protein